MEGEQHTGLDGQLAGLPRVGGRVGSAVSLWESRGQRGLARRQKDRHSLTQDLHFQNPGFPLSGSGEGRRSHAPWPTFNPTALQDPPEAAKPYTPLGRVTSVALSLWVRESGFIS